MQNQLEGAAQKLVARGLQVMRANSIMPQLVNLDLKDLVQQQHDVININIVSDAHVGPVVASNITPDAEKTTLKTIPLALNNRDGDSFSITDNELTSIENGIIPRIVDSRLEAISAYIDKVLIMKAYKNSYNIVGTPGVDPYATSTSAIRTADRMLNVALAPINNRSFVVNPYSKESLLGLQSFTDASASGDTNVITQASLGRKLGFNIHMDQNVPRHISGTAALTGGLSISGAHIIGDTTLLVANVSATTLVEGDIITIAGDTQTYVVRADVTWASSGNMPVTIQPPLKEALSGGEAITLTASHDIDIAFHKDAICFASRRVEDVIDKRLGNIIETRKDTGVSGIALCLEISRQFKQTHWQFDILHGEAITRPEHIVRIIS